jgi:hypothetical protein
MQLQPQPAATVANGGVALVCGRGGGHGKRGADAACATADTAITPDELEAYLTMLVVSDICQSCQHIRSEVPC